MLRDSIRENIRQAITELQKEGKLPEFSIPDFAVEAPDDPSHGDYATNAAMVIGKIAKKSPQDIASMLAQKLAAPSDVLAKAEPAGSGFVNLWLSDEMRESGLKEILEKGEADGNAQSNKPERIQVEFISANPTGPLTLANGRGGFFGDVLSKVLETQGYSVEREYYINDAGNQIRTLGFSLLAAGGMAPNAEEYYHGDYIVEWIKQHGDIAKVHQDDPEALGRLAAEDFLKTFIQPSIRERMKVKFDRWTSEYADIRQKDYPKKLLDLGANQGLIFESEGATWMKTTAFGDDKDRVLITNDGEPTYFFVDAGHYLETKERGFARKINVVGADHHGYVSRIQAVAKLIGLDSMMIVMQLVRLVEGGKEVRMSKRRGVYVTINELIDEVGLDAVRYFFLEKNPETHIDFDLALAQKRSKENPVFYIQYAHARLASLARKGLAAPSDFDFSTLKLEKEHSLTRQLLRFPDVLEDISRDHRVARLIRYTYGLAHAFHLFYEDSRILDAEGEAKNARMALASATAIVLRKSLSLLGISAPEEM